MEAGDVVDGVRLGRCVIALFLLLSLFCGLYRV